MKNYWLEQRRNREIRTDYPCSWVEIDLVIDTVSAPARQLKARWSKEAVEDLRAIHNLDAEKSLTEMLAREIMREIDREIMLSMSA